LNGFDELSKKDQDKVEKLAKPAKGGKKSEESGSEEENSTKVILQSFRQSLFR
jgi:hypothetical protein